MIVSAWLGLATFMIVGGQPAAVCEFPTAVRVGGCSGSLVHPEVVLYAAHCGNAGSVTFGEVAGAPAFTVAVDHCGLAPPDGMEPRDYAYCRLAEPVTDVPITPPLVGCEIAELVHGREAWIAGWGEAGEGSGGVKHWAATQIDQLFEFWLHVGEDGIGVAVGDSGSSAFLQLSDGGWRAVGAASTGGQPGNYVRMDLVIDWIEEGSGVDITPCTDATGTWMPTEACGGFSADPLAAGDWSARCVAGGLSGPADSCGPAFGEPAPDPPTVAITTPSPGTFADAEVELDLEYSVAHDWPIRRTWIEIDGEMLPDLGPGPFVYEDVLLLSGEYELVAWAEDWSGALGSSDPVAVQVGPPDAADTGNATDEGEAGGSSSSTGGSTTSTPPPPPETTSATAGESTGEPTAPADDTGSGCACHVRAGPRTQAAWMIFLLGVACYRRRREGGDQRG